MCTNTTRGFTLIELLVAMSVFAITSLMITTSFLSLIDMRRESDAKQQAFDEFRLLAENLGREALVATNFVSCGSSSDCSELRMVATTREEFSPRLIIYRLQGGRLVKAEQRDFGPCKDRVAEGGGSYTLPAECFVPVTSEGLTLSHVDFEVVHNDDPNAKPLLIFSASGTIIDGPNSTQPFAFSKSISTQPVQGADDAIGVDDRPPIFTLNTPTGSALPTNGNLFVSFTGTAYDDYGVILIDVWNNDLYQEGNPVAGRYFRIADKRSGSWVTDPQGSYSPNTTPASSVWSMRLPVQPGVINHFVFSAADTSHNTSTISYELDATALAVVPPPAFVLQGAIDCLLTSGTGVRTFVHAQAPPWPPVAAMPWDLHKCVTTDPSDCDPRNVGDLYWGISDMVGSDYNGAFRDKWESPVYGTSRWCYAARYYDIIHDVYGSWSNVVCLTASNSGLITCAGGGGTSSSGGSSSGTSGSGGSSTGGASSGRPPRSGSGGVR